jgi:uncharacterized protein (TIGR02996 family)
MIDGPALLKEAAAGDDVARLAYADWLEERGDPRAPWVRDPDLFRWMLPGGDDPAPRLFAAIEAGNDPEAREARAVLPLMGSAVVPALMEGVRGGAAWAGQALGAMAREAVRPVLPELLALVARGGEQTLGPAALALRAGGPGAAPALPALIQMLPAEASGYTNNDELADGAAGVIAAIGPKAIDAVPRLVNLLVCRSSAVAALVAIGPAAVPVILDESERLARSQLPAVATALEELASDQVPLLRHALANADDATRYLAALALAQHDPEAAMPVLVEALAAQPGNDSTFDTAYAEAIRDATAFVRPPTGALQRILPELSDPARGVIVSALERLGEAGGAMTILRRRLSDRTIRRRLAAVSTLRCLREVPEEAIAAVLPLLGDKNQNVRQETRALVIQLAGGQRGHLVEPALLKTADSDDTASVLWAMDGLHKRNSTEAREALRGLLKSKQPQVRAKAVSLLRGDAGDGLVADFTRIARERAIDTRAAAVWAFGDTGPAEAALGPIGTALSGRSDKLRVAALRALALRGPGRFRDDVLRLARNASTPEIQVAALDVVPVAGLSPEETVSFLQARLVTGPDDARAAAAYHLAGLAEQHPANVEPAIPDLLAQLGHDHSPLRDGAGWALHKLGAVAVPGLAGVLREGNETARAQAAWALMNSHAVCAPAVDALLATLRSDDVTARDRAAWALAVGVSPGTSPTPFRRLLRRENSDTTEYAITALVRLGASEAWPEVARLIDHPTDDVAACVVWAAGHLVPEEAPALWRGWLGSQRHAHRWSARLQLFLRNEMGPLTTDDLFDAVVVLATRTQVKGLLVARAEADHEAFAAMRASSTRGAHHRHGTAIEVLGRAGHTRPEEAADAIEEAINRMSCLHYQGIEALQALGAPAARRALPTVRTLAESASHSVRCLALSLMRHLLSVPGEADDAR